LSYGNIHGISIMLRIENHDLSHYINIALNFDYYQYYTISVTSTSLTTSTVVSTAVTTTSTGNWWNSLGTPTYGGTLVQWTASNIASWIHIWV